MKFLTPCNLLVYHIAKEHNIKEKTEKTLMKADYVTTTTDLFKKEILRFNKNVLVMPNAIDSNHKMWKEAMDSDKANNKGDRLRISWIGGSSHLEDLKLLDASMTKLNNSKELKDKYQIILCGFDTRGTISEKNIHTGKKTVRKINPEETVWNKFEKIFTTNHKIVSKEYLEYLKKYTKKDFKEDLSDLNYVRRWTLPLTHYGKHYKYCDVCLAPLIENTFNKVKSELKIIEAGMTKKVLIAQDFGAYKEFIKHGENGFLVPKARNHKDWYKHIKYLIDNPEEVERISNNLHNFVKDKYSIEKTTSDRVEIYKKISLN
jgi:glycosyltransferase involved in cell wall biosynthesis